MAPRSRARPAYTLIELVMCSIVTSIVMVAAGTALYVMTRGGARVESTSILNLDAAATMARLRAEITPALTVTTLTTNQIIFTCPDVTGDTTDDTISYSWSGTAGDPLVRGVNGADGVPVAEGVELFKLTKYTAESAVTFCEIRLELADGAEVSVMDSGVLLMNKPAAPG